MLLGSSGTPEAQWFFNLRVTDVKQDIQKRLTHSLTEAVEPGDGHLLPFMSMFSREGRISVKPFAAVPAIPTLDLEAIERSGTSVS